MPEDELLLRDGTEPEVEQRFRHVCFTELRAKVELDWSAFWLPPAKMQYQLRYVSAAVCGVVRVGGGA